MFNGIIFNNGKIKLIKKNKNSIFVGIETNLKINKKEIGSSFSCNGVCLTLVKIKKNLIFFYVSNETLAKSNLRYLKINHIINLEYSLVFGQKISGHFIQGHVDTTAKIKKIVSIDKTWVIKLQIFDNNFKKFLVEKASVAINGVSLTVSKVSNNFFEINVIPHTLKLTNLNKLKVNDVVNVELDIFGKYIYKYSN
jgi:riboflavin synthase